MKILSALGLEHFQAECQPKSAPALCFVEQIHAYALSAFRRSALVLPVIAVLAVAMPADAQINPFGRSKNAPRLRSSDYAMLEATAKRVYTADPAIEGASETWSNPETGASGKITMVRSYIGKIRGENYSCRKLRYDVTAKGRQQPAVYDVNWCNILSQGWKIVP
jgi:hypothetical protein